MKYTQCDYVTQELLNADDCSRQKYEDMLHTQMIMQIVESMSKEDKQKLFPLTIVDPSSKESKNKLNGTPKPLSFKEAELLDLEREYIMGLKEKGVVYFECKVNA